jgi:hypothetical protein
MNHLLQITGKDIGNLRDEDLRDLTGKLCEADYLQAGLSIRKITWGGDQDAADGGVDVRIRRLTEINPEIAQPPHNSNVPRAETVFQCKKAKKDAITPSKILEEMGKADVVQLLSELATVDGAYVIVSGGTTTEKMLNNRKKAMQQALKSIEGGERLELDFYDQTRVASWVGRHPAIALWVLEKIGRLFGGWCPYGYWANGKGALEDQYLDDTQAKLISPNSSGYPETIEVGLQRLRSQLSAPGRAVRLVGLSGVGKTRLAQALFDSRIGSNALNQYQVFYADRSDSLQPDPIHLAEQLIAAENSAIIIVDNCNEDLHRAINQRCCQNGSKVRLLSIEYDIKEDNPIETDVYRLLPSGDRLIDELIYQRYPTTSQTDRDTIARFSEGNTRLALALAETVGTGGSLTGLGDNQLFRRLFNQRQGKDKDLLDAAKSASLVYSFSIDCSLAIGPEHAVLANFYGQTPATMARKLKDLNRRALLQSRGIWRAVLPLAISNRLAKEALEEIQLDQLLSVFNLPENQRLFQSFCHRLGFLYDHNDAKTYARHLLSPQGIIGERLFRIETWKNDFSDANRWVIKCFVYIAQAIPEAALDCIESLSCGNYGEHFTSTENPHGIKVVKLLCKLAYSSDLFQRAFAILLKFGLNEQSDNKENSIRDEISILFQFSFSGTNVPPETRLEAVKDLLGSQELSNNGLGFILLKTMLKTSGFNSFDSYDFGSWPRDFGYFSNSKVAIKNWYGMILNYSVQLASGLTMHSSTVRAILAREWRMLWLNTQLYEQIELSTRNLHVIQPWTDAWIKIKETINLDGNDLPSEIKARLEKLALDLAPADLTEKVHLYVCNDTRFLLFLDDETRQPEGNAEIHDSNLMAKAYKLGVEVGHDKNLILELLPILTTTNSPRIKLFCEGLVSSFLDIHWLIEKCCLAWKTAEPDIRSLNMLSSILGRYAVYDQEAYEACLDKLVLEGDFARVFPYIQLNLYVDHKAVQRLIACLRKKSVLIRDFRILSFAWLEGRIDKTNLLDLLNALNDCAKDDVDDDGTLVMIFSVIITLPESDQIWESFAMLARQILSRYNYTYSPSKHSLDYKLETIAKTVLASDAGAETAQIIAENLLRKSTYHYSGLNPYYPRLMNSLATCQPFIFLDTFVGSLVDHGSGMDGFSDSRSFHGGIVDRPNLLGLIDESLIFLWCDQQPLLRYPALSKAVALCRKVNSEAGQPVWEWTILALKLLSKAPQIEKVLPAFRFAFFPSSWTGSRLDMIEQRLSLLHILKQHDNTDVVKWATDILSRLPDELTAARKREEKLYNESYLQFE